MFFFFYFIIMIDTDALTQKLVDCLRTNEAFSHAVFWQDWQQAEHLQRQYHAPYSYQFMVRMIQINPDNINNDNIHTEAQAKEILSNHAKYGQYFQHYTQDCAYLLEKIIQHKPDMAQIFLDSDQHRLMMAEVICRSAHSTVFKHYTHQASLQLFFNQVIGESSALFILSLNQSHEHLFDYIIQQSLVAPIDTLWLNEMKENHCHFVPARLQTYLQMQKNECRPSRVLHRNWEHSIHHFYHTHPQFMTVDEGVLLLAQELVYAYPEKYTCAQHVCTSIIDELVISSIKTHGITKNQDIPELFWFKQAFFHLMEQVYQTSPELLPSLKSSHPEIRQLHGKFVLHEKLDNHFNEPTNLEQKEEKTIVSRPSKI